MRIIYKNKFRSGFSLLELLIYVAILAIVATVVAGAFFSINQGRARVEAATEVNSNVRIAVETMAQDIKRASEVAVPTIAGATSTALHLTVDGLPLVYCISDGHVRRQSDGACTAASSAITGDSVIVDSLVFTRMENSNGILGKTFVTVSIALSIRYNSAAPEWQYAVTKETTVALY